MDEADAPTRLVLWDIDGTLLNAAGLGWHLMSTAFSHLHGVPLGELVTLSGRTDRAIITEALARHDLRDAAHVDALIAAIGALADRSRASIADEIIGRGGGVLIGAGEAVAALARQPGVLQSVLSGNTATVGAVKLGAFPQFERLDFSVSAFGDHHLVRADLVDVAREKFGHRFGVGRDGFDTVLIGDTPLDVEAAQRSGAAIVAVATGRHGVAELTGCGAPVVLADLRDTGALVAAVLAGARPR